MRKQILFLKLKKYLHLFYILIISQIGLWCLYYYHLVRQYFLQRVNNNFLLSQLNFRLSNINIHLTLIDYFFNNKIKQQRRCIPCDLLEQKRFESLTELKRMLKEKNLSVTDPAARDFIN